ncbi:hypothetical protein LARI1_G007024 [Lachnellula arida]|uniref:ARCA protein n=1 Tax=Lachnellula arida TaxID=1316785 RepID=A0A8T9B364_9HELO|nr:hypothetical protein LARI1_G007024 [Lachnellula arida]
MVILPPTPHPCTPLLLSWGPGQPPTHGPLSVQGNSSTPTTGAPKANFGNLRFRHGSSARYDSDFAKDQVWVSISGQVCSQFVDELPELHEIYSTTPKSEQAASVTTPQQSRHTETESPAASLTAPSNLSAISEDFGGAQSASSWIPRSALSETQLTSPAKRRCSNKSDRSSFRSLSQTSGILSTYPQSTSSFAGSPIGHGDAIDSLLRAADYSDHHRARQPEVLSSPQQTQISPYNEIVHSPSMSRAWPEVRIQEACLMRYFIDELACWFDLCDPERHFALVVPQRSQHCPALLNAIYTASARHLCRLDQYKNKKDDSVEYLEKRLPDLHIETAVEYHSRSIEHLVAVSHDSEAIFDENLLVASIILRFYEEVDAPLNGGDWETGLRGTQVFIEAQASAGHATSLRRAAFRVACRQEVYMAFIKQRPFSLPQHDWNDYRSLEPADDHTWAHRVVVHCADVLMYCYGEHRSNNSDYDASVEYHASWDRLRPKSFEPIYSKPADPSQGEVWPELWYLSDCHVTAVQHLDLSKILLTVYDPRIPRLGPSHRAAIKRIEAEVNEIVKRLCGVAISNRRAPPAMNTACMAIAMCGDQFTDPREQQSILDVLVYTDTKHAWPTKEIQNRLKEAWGWMV